MHTGQIWLIVGLIHLQVDKGDSSKKKRGWLMINITYYTKNIYVNILITCDK